MIGSAANATTYRLIGSLTKPYCTVPDSGSISAHRHEIGVTCQLTLHRMYWTNEPDSKGDARFFNDVHVCEQAVLNGRNNPSVLQPYVDGS